MKKLWMLGIVLVLLGAFAMPAAAVDKFGCSNVVLNGTAMTTPEAGTPYFRGDIPVLIDGRAYTIDSRSLNMGNLPAPEGGPSVGRLLHRWEIRENGEKLVTKDTIWTTPSDDPNVLDAVIQFQVIGGGRFNCGEIISTGVIDLTVPAFIGSTFRGAFCNCQHSAGRGNGPDN